MSKESSSNGDSRALLNGDGPEHEAGRPESESGVAAHRHVHGAGPATKRRTGYAFDDYRFGSLQTGPPGTVPVTSTRTVQRRRHHRPLLLTAAVFVVVAAIAIYLIQSYVVQPYGVRGDAMTPVLQSGDRMLVLKSDFLPHSISAGDIVVVRPSKALPCSVGGSAGDLVLRVAAVPGSVISSKGDSIFVDGRPLHEAGWYDPRFGELGGTPIRTTTLAADRYFVLADNRSNGCDSRTFGPILKSAIAGEGIAVVGRNGHVALGTL